MTIKERASNLEENYCELRGYSYLFNLLVNDIHSGEFTLSNDSLVALDTLHAFITQKIGELEIDLGKVIAEVVKAS